MLYVLSIIVGLATLATAWLPESHPSSTTLGAFNTGNGKIRGVNAGSQYIVEPWMVGTIWTDKLGCSKTEFSERQCIEGTWKNNVAGASDAWLKHWDSWITQKDIKDMVTYGLNTIRIPVGFWMKEDLVNSTVEHFPKGGMKHLQEFCGLASEAGMYIIIDFHGLPGRQENNSNTGDTTNSTPGFYQSDYESERAYEFLEWMVENIHTNDNMTNVGAIELINEPLRENSPDTQWMVERYYTSAVDRINGKEKELRISDNQKLSIVVMDQLWGSGPPAVACTGSGPPGCVNSPLLFDDHNYQKDAIPEGPDDVRERALKYTCEGSRVGDSSEAPKFVGEWSMKLDISQDQNQDFFRKYFSAQQMQYEKTRGWVFWSWRVDGPGDAVLWSYKDAVNANIIDKDLDAMLNSNPCG